VNTQVVFTLKGNPLNVWDLKRDIVYKNDEVYNLMRALDIEENIDHLRYDKVILATKVLKNPHGFFSRITSMK